MMHESIHDVEGSAADAVQRADRGRWSFWIRPAVACPPGMPMGVDPLLGWLVDVAGGDVAVLRVLKEELGRSTVQLVTAFQRRWIVKRYHRPPRLARWLRRSPAWREWRGAQRLFAAGVRCNRPLALCRGAAMSDEVLVLPYVEGACLHHLVADAPPPARWDATYRTWRRKAAYLAGEQIARLSEAGLANRDHKIGNLIMDEACESLRAEPILIDPVGVVPLRFEAQLIRQLAILRATAEGAGHVSRVERFEVLKALVERDPNQSAAAARQRLRRLARRVEAASARGDEVLAS